VRNNGLSAGNADASAGILFDVVAPGTHGLLDIERSAYRSLGIVGMGRRHPEDSYDNAAHLLLYGTPVALYKLAHRLDETVAKLLKPLRINFFGDMGRLCHFHTHDGDLPQLRCVFHVFGGRIAIGLQ
jgi:hypothetical protein